jgi:solute carrier family 25 folate transporter 32
MQVIDTPDHVYRTVRRALPAVIKNEGIRGLYQGLTPAIVAASGSWGGYFYFYEASKKRKLEYYRENHIEYAHKIQGLSTTDYVSVFFSERCNDTLSI